MSMIASHRARLAAAVALLTGLAVLLGALPAAASAAPKPRFDQRTLPLTTLKLYDLSVVDVEGDGDLDLFSTHHRFRGNLLTRDGGRWIARLDRSRLSATAHVPGFDDAYSRPEFGPAGLYIWVDHKARTHIVTKDLDRIPTLLLNRVKGSIRYLGRDVEIRKQRGARTTVRSDSSTEPDSGILEFDSGPDSEIVVRTGFMDQPFEISIDPIYPRQRILLGPRRSVPPEHDVRIDLGDRHGVAWADFNRDGAIDAYITNGANRGAFRFAAEVNDRDEFFFGNGDGRFSQDIETSRIEKGRCRGRYAAPVDYDRDGDLDLFVGCEAGSPMLWQQKKPPGKFGSQSSLLQRLKVRGELFRWIDLDRDRYPELIAITKKRRMRVYSFDAKAGRFRRTQAIRPAGLGKTLYSMTIGDYDGDLDPDAFVSSRGGNTLLVNRRGKLRPKRPGTVGLPRRKTLAFSFVDFNNDGLLDLHAAPQGLYVRRPNGKYRQTNKLRVADGGQWAVSQWIDLGEDGDRDLVELVKRRGITVRARAYDNRTRGGHWLHVDLEGTVANAQAIGAKVVVVTRRGKQAGWVGQSEGSRFSSGHYRLYFGLGRARSAKRVKVLWPDGRKSVLRDVPADRLLEIAAPG